MQAINRYPEHGDTDCVFNAQLMTVQLIFNNNTAPRYDEISVELMRS
jgi:hypothetical protein